MRQPPLFLVLSSLLPISSVFSVQPGYYIKRSALAAAVGRFCRYGTLCGGSFLFTDRAGVEDSPRLYLQCSWRGSTIHTTGGFGTSCANRGTGGDGEWCDCSGGQCWQPLGATPDGGSGRHLRWLARHLVAHPDICRGGYPAGAEAAYG